MTDELKNAQELLLTKTFIQKGTQFQNLVDSVSLNPLNSKEILIGYTRQNDALKTSSTMEFKQFLGNHFV